MFMIRKVLFATAMAIALASTDARANPLEGHDCFSKDIMRRIPGCTSLLEQPGLAPSVRAHAFAFRALALSLIGRYAEAIADYDKAIEIIPDYAVALNNRAWALYKMGRVDEAFPDVERSLRLDPGSPHAFDTRAHLRQAKGQSDGAYNDYMSAMRLGGPRMVRLYQCGLQAKGLYHGPLSGIFSSSLDDALKQCVKSTECDPLPPDEECKEAVS